MPPASTDTIDQTLSRALLHIRRQSPFFATLSLFAHYHWSDGTRTAATDGKDVFLNPGWFTGLSGEERCGILLHEILHAALAHVPRRGKRAPMRWNIAADIVVNGMIDGLRDIRLPIGALRAPALAELSVEEIYERISYRDCHWELVLTDDWNDLHAHEPCTAPNAAAPTEAVSAYWRAALNKAFLAQRMAKGTWGRLPAALLRAWDELQQPQLDWRTVLWRYLARTPCDFAGYDRRFIHQGLYLDALEGESLHVAVCVDTSGSVTTAMLGEFRAEVASIVRAYPHLRVDLYFADTALHGPHALVESGPLPTPVGNGGTSFVPFFDRLAQGPQDAVSLAVYLTDGEGDFPRQPPEIPVLWVITPGGRGSGKIPFGEVVRLADS